MSGHRCETGSTRKAVVLAAGAGSRMRRSDHDRIGPGNREAAREGLKGLIRFHDRPFIDYVIQSLIEAGLDDICLVISSARNRLWEYYEAMAEVLTGAGLAFATQEEPLGTRSQRKPPSSNSFTIQAARITRMMVRNNVILSGSKLRLE